MTHREIRTIGHFLSFYATDLTYIKNFQKFKLGEISDIDYCAKSPGSFYSFLIEFRVIRNIRKDSVHQLLSETKTWITGNDPDNVDAFAKYLSQTNLTLGKVPKSMCSKILFLNNPWQIIPMDRLVRETLDLRENDYEQYLIKLNRFKIDNESIIENCFRNSNDLARITNDNFSDVSNIEIIQRNRLLDKYLWTTENKGFW